MNQILKDDFEKQADYSKVPAEVIDNLEKSFEAKLPQSYKEFMTTYGSVMFEYPVPNSVISTFAEEEKIVVGLLSFLSPLDIQKKYNELREMTYYADEGQITEKMIPILDMTEVDDSDYIVIKLTDGSIWHSRYMFSQESDPDSFGFVAKDFTTFLKNISTYEGLKHFLNKPEINKTEAKIIPDDFFNDSDTSF